MKQSSIIILLIFALTGCDGVVKKTSQTASSPEIRKTIHVPVFESDSSYSFIAQQIAFGPRVPGTSAHTNCALWLKEKMEHFADTVMVQDFKARVYNKKILDGKNIISSFNPKAGKRILLAAHWDSRPYADHDPDPANHRKPIDGANDGASGVGILMEIARLIKNSPLDPILGVDIIFFDLEDYGPHNDERSNGDDDFWALGAQYWSRNPHKSAYKAQFGILLDMVGASNPVFPREYYSQQYAAWVLDKTWRTAQRLGYDNYFVNKPGYPINDDHIPVNRIAGIPMIDIIHIDQNSVNGTFYDHWHTLNDNLDQIDVKTLQIVGEVVTTVIYEEQ